MRGNSITSEVSFVYVRRGNSAGPLSDMYTGPYKLLRRSDKVYELQVGNRVEKVAADRLKPHLGEEPVPAQPPRRGRPPGSGGSGSPGSGLGEGHVDGEKICKS